MSFSPDGTKLACGTDNDIRVYDVDTGTLVLGPLWGHQGWVFDLLWSHDGNKLFSGSTDRTIRGWNSDTGEQIGQVTPTGYALSSSPQMNRSLRARPWTTPFVSGMRLLVIPCDNTYNMIMVSTLFVSLPPVNSPHQRDGMRGEYPS